METRLCPFFNPLCEKLQIYHPFFFFPFYFFLFFLPGLRKQVTNLYTHNKSFSKLDLTTVLTVFSFADTALSFCCIVRVSYTLIPLYKALLRKFFSGFLSSFPNPFISSWWSAHSLIQVTSRKYETLWNAFPSYSIVYLMMYWRRNIHQFTQITTVILIYGVCETLTNTTTVNIIA